MASEAEDALRKQLKSSQDELKKAAATIKAKENELRKLRKGSNEKAELKGAKDAMSLAEERLTLAETRLEGKDAYIEVLETRVDEMTGRSTDQLESIGGMQKELVEVQEELEEARGEAADLEVALTAAQDSVVEKESEIAGIRAELEAANDSRAQAEAEVLDGPAASLRKLEEEKADIETALARQSAVMKAREERIAYLEENLAGEKLRVESLTSDLTAATSSAAAGSAAASKALAKLESAELEANQITTTMANLGVPSSVIAVVVQDATDKIRAEADAEVLKANSLTELAEEDSKLLRDLVDQQRSDLAASRMAVAEADARAATAEMKASDAIFAALEAKETARITDAKIQDGETKIQVLTDRSAALSQDIVRLRQELADKTIECDNAIAEATKATVREDPNAAGAVALAAKLVAAEAQIAGRDARLEALRKRYTEDKDLFKQRGASDDTLRIRIESLEESLRQKDATIDELKLIEVGLKTTLTARKEAMAAGETKILEYKQARDQRIEQNTKLLGKIKMLEDQLADANDVRKGLEIDLVTQKALVEGAEERSKANQLSQNTLRAIIADLQARCKAVTEERDTHQVRAESLKVDFTHAEAEIERFKVLAATKDKALAVSKAKQQMVDQEMRSISQRHQILQEQFKRSQDMRLALQKDLDATTKELSEAASTLDDAQIRTEEAEAAASKSEIEIRTQASLIAILKERVERTSADRDAHVGLLAEQVQLTSTNLKARAVEAYSEVSQPDALAAAAEQATRRAAKLEAALSTARADAMARATLVQTLTRQIDSAEAKVGRLTSVETRLRAELRDAEISSRNDRAALGRLEQLARLSQTDIGILQQTIQKLRADVVGGSDVKGVSVEELDKLSRTLDQDRRALHDAAGVAGANGSATGGGAEESALGKLYFQSVLLLVKTQLAAEDPSGLSNSIAPAKIYAEVVERALPYDEWPGYVLQRCKSR